MKKDMDLVRELLLRIEAEEGPTLAHLPEIAGRTQEQIAYHAQLMIDRGLITGIDVTTHGEVGFIELMLTWAGHEFLDTVRDNEIWSQTKAGASKVGSWSLDLLASLAKGLVMAKAQSLGLPVG